MPRTDQAADREVTLTGCIARDTTKPAAGQATESFLLTNAKVGSGAGATASSARGAAGSGQQQTGTANMGQEYRLMAKGDVNFAPHVNHQVRVTGTMMGRGMAQNQTGAPNRPEAGTPNQGNRGDAPTAASAGAMAAMFHVTELTMVSATCEAK